MTILHDFKELNLRRNVQLVDFQEKKKAQSHIHSKKKYLDRRYNSRMIKELSYNERKICIKTIFYKLNIDIW